MNKKIRQEYMTVAAMFVAIAFFAVLLFLIPLTENYGSINSQEVDDYLYKKLDEYARAYEGDPDLAKLFITAMRNPDELTPTERHTYLAIERKFFNGWELAWTYRYEGYFDDHRYSKWDSWYIDELRRRPPFVWTENRKHFSYSEAFVQHVDASANEQ